MPHGPLTCANACARPNARPPPYRTGAPEDGRKLVRTVRTVDANGVHSRPAPPLKYPQQFDTTNRRTT